MLNPALYLVVFYVVFQLILGSGIPNFPIFLLSGLLVWNLFSVGLVRGHRARSWPTRGSSARCVPAGDPPARLGRRRARALLPAGDRAGARRSWSSATTSPSRTCRCCRSRSWRCWRSPPALGVLLAASLNVKLRDTAHFVELALLAWFWMTPIVYPYERRRGEARRLSVCSTSSTRSPGWCSRSSARSTAQVDEPMPT